MCVFYPLLNIKESAFDNSSGTLLGERIDWRTVLALVEPRLTVYMVTVVIMSVCAQLPFRVSKEAVVKATIVTSPLASAKMSSCNISFLSGRHTFQ